MNNIKDKVLKNGVIIQLANGLEGIVHGSMAWLNDEKESFLNLEVYEQNLKHWSYKEWDIIKVLDEDRKTLWEQGKTNWEFIDKDTKVLVKNKTSNNWLKRYFAYYKNDKYYCYVDGTTSWTANENKVVPWYICKLAEEE